MKKSELVNTLIALLPKLEGTNFALLGTGNLVLQGIDLIPRDLDFITDDIGIEKISQIFNTELVADEDFGYLETEFPFNNQEIHFVSAHKNPLRPENFLDHTIPISVEGVQIPALSLESEYETYSKMGRDKDKVKLGLIKAKLG